MSVWTVLAAVVASATALWIAYKVYPRQKELDRNLQLLKDLNDAYVDLFAQLDRAASASKLGGDHGHSIVYDAKSAINRILLLEKSPPVEQLTRLSQSLFDILESSTSKLALEMLEYDPVVTLVEDADWLIAHHRQNLHPNSSQAFRMPIFLTNTTPFTVDTGQ